jgi:hypothetical protein
MRGPPPNGDGAPKEARQGTAELDSTSGLTGKGVDGRLERRKEMGEEAGGLAVMDERKESSEELRGGRNQEVGGTESGGPSPDSRLQSSDCSACASERVATGWRLPTHQKTSSE